MATSLTALFGMDATGMRNELKKVRREFNTLGKIGIAAATAAFAKFSNDALKLGATLDATSQKLGISAERIQEIGFAAKQFEISQETANMALQRFSRRLAEAQQGSGEFLPIVEQYNLQLRDSAGNARTAEAVLGDFAETIKSIESPTERLRVAFKAFDSEGVGLVNVLKDGEAGLKAWGDQARESGNVLTNETVAALADAENAINNFKDRVTVAVGNIIVNFRTADGLAALGFGLMEIAARFGGKILDLFDRSRQVISATIGGALVGTANKFRDALVDRVISIAEQINRILPSNYELNIGNLEALKSSGDDIAMTVAQAIAQTKPSAFSETFGDYWKGLRENAQAAADALTASEFTKTPQKLQHIAHQLSDEITESAETLATAGQQAASPIAAAAQQIAAAADSLRKGIIGIRGGDQFNTASDEALSVIANRNRATARRITSGVNDNLGNQMTAARLVAEAMNAERELAFRNDFRRTVALGGEAAAYREFQNIDPLQIERLLDQFTRNLSESQRSANNLDSITRGLQRSGIIPTV